MQRCEGVPKPPGSVQLQTVAYRYTITPASDNEPLFRWEYEKRPATTDRHCRHHLHKDITSQSLGLQMRKLHIPTGYTLIEDIIRFCINDLGVKPRSPSWHDELEESESRFKRDYAIQPGDRR
jgi:hypothetical protein